MFAYKEYVDGLLRVADGLIKASNPDRAAKCSAVSRLYYALFSELCGSNADAFIGLGLRKAWGEVYRGLNHGEARTACKRLKNMKEFPQELREFAHLFEQSQGWRHLADYDPTVDFYAVDIQNWLYETRQIITRFRKVSLEDKRAFAAWVLMHSEGSKAIRKHQSNADGDFKTPKKHE